MTRWETYRLLNRSYDAIFKILKYSTVFGYSSSENMSTWPRDRRSSDFARARRFMFSTSSPSTPMKNIRSNLPNGGYLSSLREKCFLPPYSSKITWSQYIIALLHHCLGLGQQVCVFLVFLRSDGSLDKIFQKFSSSVHHFTVHIPWKSHKSKPIKSCTQNFGTQKCQLPPQYLPI